MSDLSEKERDVLAAAHRCANMLRRMRERPEEAGYLIPDYYLLVAGLADAATSLSRD